MNDAIACIWREEIDSLAFVPPDHGGQCVIHRRAFRALLGVEPDAQACRDYFERHADSFKRAAAEKIRRAELPVDANFHLNSRNIARTLAPPR